jgi:hypothetical protein
VGAACGNWSEAATAAGARTVGGCACTAAVKEYCARWQCTLEAVDLCDDEACGAAVPLIDGSTTTEFCCYDSDDDGYVFSKRNIIPETRNCQVGGRVDAARGRRVGPCRY